MAELVREEKAKTAEEADEPAVTRKQPRSAGFLVVEYSFNALLLLISVHYIATVYALLKYCDSKWMSVGLIALVTLMIGLMLYAILLLKGEHTEKYAMAPLAAQVAVADKAAAGSNV